MIQMPKYQFIQPLIANNFYDHGPIHQLYIAFIKMFPFKKPSVTLQNQSQVITSYKM